MAIPPIIGPNDLVRIIKGLNDRVLRLERRQDLTDITWHTVGAPGEPAFQGGWSNYSTGPTGWEGILFGIDALGFVQLSGLCKNTVTFGAGIIFTLPPGFRPRSNQAPGSVSQGRLFGCAAQSAIIRIDVYGNGNVFFQGPITPTTISLTNLSYVSLDNIHFKAEQ